VVFRQIVHDDLGCASYLVGDEHAGVAAVVDPKLAIDEYLALAHYLGVRIEHILETHTHADHVSGHGRLAAATGARIHIHACAGAEYDHDAIEDGWELALGDVLIRAVHAPGHRPEHTVFALIDAGRGEEPWALLTGDSMFVGDLARPDLAVEPHDGARALHRSLRRLLELPPYVEVWPGHLGGSMCGGPGMDMKVSSTLGFEQAHNALLAERDEDRFVARALEGLGPQPPNFRAIVERNRGPLVRRDREAHPLTPRQVDQHGRDGALVVDLRTELQFDEAHIAGAISITALRAGFGSRLAWLARPGQPVVLVGRGDEDARRAHRLAAAVGIDEVAGYLAGGMTSWREERRQVQDLERVAVGALRERLDREPGLQVLDVRERAEWESGHIPGSLFTPYHDLDALPEGLDPGRPVAVICASGQRAVIGASLIQRLGAREVLHVVDGGVGTWARQGEPIER
jgi:hydroxyacylglutathione hydrolase